MIVHYCHKTRFSGRLLAERLADMPGPDINFGYGVEGGLNSPSAISLSANKRLALERFIDSGVPTPRVFTEYQPALEHLSTIGPLIGRPNYHFGGHGWYFIRTERGLRRALRRGATHFLEFIPQPREFRVHIVNGKSIKIAEKIGGGNRKNFKHGAYFAYPDFDHKKTLRRIAKQAVMSLGLDFGAVDILYLNDKYFVLECNTAPSLTSASDTLERYIKAFKDNYGG